MEEQKQGLVKAAETRLPKFVEDAYESIDKMEKFANILLSSKLVPNHFYEKLPDGKPDFSKGKTPAVVAVLIQGYQLQLPPLTALQHIIPVNGLLSIKGDLAKSMIFNSGKLKSGSWVEEETGSIDDGNLVVKITATRADNGQTLSRSFSVAQAKRAGLWITEQQVNGSDGWKYKSSAWWKFPSRMINYRALGFLARDMFPDVMAGIYTTEEAMDFSKDATEVIETESGAKITIPDKDHSKARSSKMTDRVADKIPDNKFGKVGNENIQEATVVTEPVTTLDNVMDAMKTPEKKEEESPFVASKESTEYMNGVKVIRDATTHAITNMDEINGVQSEGNAPVDDKPEVAGSYTLAGLEKLDTEVLRKMVMDDMDLMECSEIIGGKNTNKKLRELIFAHQNGTLAEYMVPHLKANVEKEKQKEALVVNKEPNTQTNEITPNKEFDNFLDDKPKDKVVSGNKYKLDIPEYDKGSQRDFALTKILYNKMIGLDPQITSPRYLVLAEKLGLLEKYKDKEVFCRDASIAEINLLLNSN